MRSTGSFPTSRCRCNAHSKFTGDSAILGVLMLILGASVRLLCSISEISGGKSPDEMFIDWSNCSVTMLTTNSLACKIFSAVCFIAPFFRVTERMTRGGEEAIALKKLYGAAFTVPCSFIDVMNAIGRGTTAPTSRLYVSRDESVFGSMTISLFLQD